MENKYLVSISGTQTVNNENTKTQLVAPCNYKIKNGEIYISYEEYDEGDKNKKSLSVIKVDSNGMTTLLREGAQNVKLTLEKGKRHVCHYSMEFIDTMIGVYTHNIKCDFSEKQCDIELNYALDINTEHLSNNKVIINVKEINNV